MFRHLLIAWAVLWAALVCGQPAAAQHTRMHPRCAPSASATYLPTLGSPPVSAKFAFLAVPTYRGPLYQLRKTTDGSTLDVYYACGSNLPSYTAIDAWDPTHVAVVSRVYEQAGGAFGDYYQKFVSTGSSEPYFSTRYKYAGIVPFTFDALSAGAGVRHLVSTGNKIDPRTMSTCTITQMRSLMEGQPYFTFTQPAQTTYVELHLPTTGVNLTATVSGTSVTGPLARSNVDVDCLRTQTTTLDIWQNGTKTTLTQATPNTTFETLTTGLTIKASANGTKNLFGDVVYAATLSDADMVTLSTALKTMGGVNTTYGERIVVIGDSISRGGGAGFNMNAMQAAVALGLFVNNPEILNYGVNGEQITTANTNRATRYTSTNVTAGSVVIIQGVTNDLAGVGGSTKTAAQVEATVTSLVTYIHSLNTGVKVIVVAPTPRCAPLGACTTFSSSWDNTKQAEWTTYRADVLATSTPFGADGNCDPAPPASTMGATNAVLDATLYDATSVGALYLHPTAFGHELLAPVYIACITARLGSAP